MIFPTWRILTGDCRETLRTLQAGSVQTCVTSPPYYGLRDYGTDGQLGLEATPDEYVTGLVDVFRGVRRALRDDGTVWLNLGDSYAVNGGAREYGSTDGATGRADAPGAPRRAPIGYKPKDLLGIPWMVAFALRADGWYLRSEIIWAKRNCMPESVTDRPTKAHEQIFLLSKRPSYFYDADAIREAHDGPLHAPGNTADVTVEQIRGANASKGMSGHYAEPDRTWGNPAGRNKRSVWTVATQPYPGAHFATFPAKLIEPCILAGCPERACGVCGAPWERIVERERWNGREERRGQVAGDAHLGQQQRIHNTNGQSSGVEVRTVGWAPSCGHDAPHHPGTVLDPFAGAGTTGLVALRHNRSFIGIELNPAYATLARDRIIDDSPLLNTHAEVMP